ncbi:MAG: inositol monophosphatase [Anaerolineae bacterium]|nr:inositol monophosphatase [Anaerolineae bacterium]
MEPTLAQCILWARQAGQILRAGYGARHTIGFKTDNDLVTEFDRKAEAFLIAQIRGDFPEHTIVGEEGGNHAGSEDDTWYIDPVDGTTNFAHGLPYFCVSLGYSDGEGCRLGVVYDPIADECFAAERGRGAYLNDQPIHVSDISQLKRALVVTGFSHNEWEYVGVNNQLSERINARAQSLRRMGSSALNQAYVAAGRMDAYWELLVKPWDIGAGILIVREAGGIVTRMDGSQGGMLQPPCNIIASTPGIYQELFTQLKNSSSA